MNRRSLLQGMLGGIASLVGLIKMPRFKAAPRYTWLVVDGCNSHIEECDSEEAARELATDAIDCYLEEGEWIEGVEQIQVFKVVETYAAKQANVVTRDMLDSEGYYNGRYYSGSYDHWCDYELTPVG